jgi:hypothetical protein
MIAFGVAVGCEQTYERWALPGIRRVWERDAELFEQRGARSIFTAYNRFLDAATALDDLEALVLIHHDTEILDERFGDKVRASIAEPDVAILGAMGGIGVTSVAWWQASRLYGGFRPTEGLRLAPPWERGRHEVDCVDGFIMAFSPWAVRELRFDESLAPGFHAYDVDICTEARARGRRVLVEDIAVGHPIRDVFPRDPWVAAYVAYARKWEGRLP